jgi:short-subunit dehydrogenase
MNKNDYFKTRSIGSYSAIDEARRQFEVNIFGLVRLTQRGLPKMRENRYGKIVTDSIEATLHNVMPQYRSVKVLAHESLNFLSIVML